MASWTLLAGSLLAAFFWQPIELELRCSDLHCGADSTEAGLCCAMLCAFDLGSGLGWLGAGGNGLQIETQ